MVIQSGKPFLYDVVNFRMGCFSYLLRKCWVLYFHFNSVIWFCRFGFLMVCVFKFFVHGACKLGNLTLHIVNLLLKAITHNFAFTQVLLKLCDLIPSLNRLLIIRVCKVLHEREHFDNVAHLILGRGLNFFKRLYFVADWAEVILH